MFQDVSPIIFLASRQKSEHVTNSIGFKDLFCTLFPEMENFVLFGD